MPLPPTFVPNLATTMSVLSQLTYAQYQAGLQNPNYDGSIAGLTPAPPAGFVQTASFKAPEIDLRHNSSVLKNLGTNVDLKNLGMLAGLAFGLQKVYCGFAGTLNGINILALRGTQSGEEWVADISGIQVDVLLFGDKFLHTKAHLGFLTLYAFLQHQVHDAVQAFNPANPCVATGHSLGHPLALFSALTAKLGVYAGASSEMVQLYSFAGPRVGDPAFATTYEQLIPSTFRVVNLADVVPIAPPSKIFGFTYQHVGQEWSYLSQQGDIGANHSLADNYIGAVSPPNQVETDAPRTYPVSGL